jgi:hypothetical protein
MPEDEESPGMSSTSDEAPYGSQLHISECVHHGRPHAGGCLGLDPQIAIYVPPGATFPYDDEAEKAFKAWWNGWLASTGYTDDRWQRDLAREAYLSGRNSKQALER